MALIGWLKCNSVCTRLNKLLESAIPGARFTLSVRTASVDRVNVRFYSRETRFSAEYQIPLDSLAVFGNILTELIKAIPKPVPPELSTIRACTEPVGEEIVKELSGCLTNEEFISILTDPPESIDRIVLEINLFPREAREERDDPELEKGDGDSTAAKEE